MTNITTNIQLYETLKQNLGQAEAEAVVGFVDNRLKEAEENYAKTLATKEDLKDLRLATQQDLNELKLSTQQDFNDLKLELKVELKDMRDELKNNISTAKVDTMRWVFALFTATMITIISLSLRK
jgi:hypothetical protein